MKTSFSNKLSRFTRNSLVSLLAIAAFAPTAFSYGYGWDIDKFDTAVKINEDGIINVTETIVADYTNESHHGLIRSIPVDYRDRYGNNLSLYFQVTSVTDENGKSWNYEQYKEGNILNIKIGDADILLDEPSTFKISYNVGRAINRFDTYDELYWNSTGTQWDVPMDDVTTEITLPDKVSASDIKATCFTGSYGGSEQNCTPNIQNHSVTYSVNDNKTLSTPDLNPLSGLTVVVGFPKGIVAEPSVTQQAWWFFMDNWGYALPFITFGILYYIWYTRGRDPKTRDTIMPIYKAPEGMSPTEIGTIIDENLDMRDITSTIVDMAVRGYIQIKELKEKKLIFDNTDYEFIKLKNYENGTVLKTHERKILDAIFGSSQNKKLSSLKNEFYSSLPGIREAVYNSLVKEGYFPTNPEKVRNIYYTIGSVLCFGVLFGLGAFIAFFPLSAILGILASGVVVLGFAKYMPAKTKKGVDMYYQAKGLEMFIKTAERDRIKFQEQENIFEKILPFAMTLGLASKWANAFEGIYKTAPSWYVSSNPNWNNNFNVLMFTNRLDSVASEMQTTFASSPRSASGGGSGFSGGFSGGGFGGGGGSSW